MHQTRFHFNQIFTDFSFGILCLCRGREREHIEIHSDAINFNHETRIRTKATYVRQIKDGYYLDGESEQRNARHVPQMHLQEKDKAFYSTVDHVHNFFSVSVAARASNKFHSMF